MAGKVLIAVGVTGMLVSVFADSIGVGYPGFGIDQLSGVIIGALVTVVGLVKVLFAGTPTLLRVLAGIYVGGIFYAGLKSDPSNTTHRKMLLYSRSFEWHDFAMNTAAFILLGYLFMLSLGIVRTDQRNNSLIKMALVVAGAGGLISLFLEVSQYYLISGRYSNLMDLIANTLGTLVGISIYLFMEQNKVICTGMKRLWKLGDTS